MSEYYRLGDLDRWKGCNGTERVSFDKQIPGRVRLHVHCFGPVPIWLRYPDTIGFDPEIPYYLGEHTGLAHIEFTARGPFTISSDTEGLYFEFYTAEGEDWSVDPVEPESFARIVERQPRNPEFERMAALAMANAERMINERLGERERVFEQRIAERDLQYAAELAAATSKRAEAKSAVASPEASGTSGPVTNGGAPDESAASAGGATGGGKDGTA